MIHEFNFHKAFLAGIAIVAIVLFVIVWRRFKITSNVSPAIATLRRVRQRRDTGTIVKAFQSKVATKKLL